MLLLPAATPATCAHRPLFRLPCTLLVPFLSHQPLLVSRGTQGGMCAAVQVHVPCCPLPTALAGTLCSLSWSSLFHSLPPQVHPTSAGRAAAQQLGAAQALVPCSCFQPPASCLPRCIRVSLVTFVGDGRPSGRALEIGNGPHVIGSQVWKQAAGGRQGRMPCARRSRGWGAAAWGVRSA